MEQNNTLKKERLKSINHNQLKIDSENNTINTTKLNGGLKWKLTLTQ